MKKYLLIIAIMVLTILAAGCIGNNNVEVVGDNLEVTAHTVKTYSGGGSQVNVTVKNKGTSEKSYVPINVTFYDSNGKISGSEGGIVINLKPGEEMNTTIESWSGGDSYKLIVGDPKTKVKGENFANALEPLVESYNSSRGPDTSSFEVIGTPINAVNGLTNGSKYYSLDGKATIFVEMYRGYISVGNYVYENGAVVAGGQPYIDVAVVYWPEMKVVGWHRLYGTTPREQETGHGEAISGALPDIDEWIKTLSQ